MKNGLFKNESIKIWSQTSNRVIVIILAVIIIFTPVVSFLFKTIFSGNSFGSSDAYENYLVNPGDGAAASRRST